MTTINTLKARVGALSRSRPADDPDLVTTRRALKAERLRDQIDRAVHAEPVLTAEQRVDLASILFERKDAIA